MKKSIFHGVVGAGAVLTIAVFWISTLVSELFLGNEAVILVKQAIVHYGLIILFLFMVSLGASGFSLGKERMGRIVEAKRNRMPVIVLNGLLVMIPTAIFLHFKAFNGQFDVWFYVGQALELLVGLVQLALLGLSFRDGLKLTAARTRGANFRSKPWH